MNAPRGFGISDAFENEDALTHVNELMLLSTKTAITWCLDVYSAFHVCSSGVVPYNGC